MNSNSKQNSATCCCGSRQSRIALGVLAFLLVAVAIIVPTTYAATRPETVVVLQTEQEETLPNLIKVAPLGTAAIAIEYTELLDDNSTVFYYLSAQDLNATMLTNNDETDPDNLALYLTHSDNPTLDDISLRHEDQAGGLRRKISSTESALRIGLINSVDFPYQLPESFLPGDFNGAIVIEENSEDLVDFVRVASASFALIVDPERNIGSSGVVEPPRTSQPPTQSPSSGTIRRPFDPSIVPPTSSPTNTPVRDSSQLPAILSSDLSGSYNIDGTVTIDYVQGFRNGRVVDLPRLQFDIPNLSDAPGPYLYLSKRPYSETKRGNLNNQDIPIPIDSGSDGKFNVKGQFEQFLDEIENVQDLEDYANGSWIVWCRPFGVWIGGGEIVAS